ncbi:MAG: hypothetical protein EB059_07525 [Alphaproteobacteria bacterium]|nr:hypothetical protein [Alphaproteobacteria bacterium]
MADGDHIIIPQRVVANDFKRQLEHYRLTTAEILYRIPDHPQLLQSFIWQDLDLLPQFPVLRRFLSFWQTSLEGKLYQVRIAVVDHISSRDYQVIEKELTIQ